MPLPLRDFFIGHSPRYARPLKGGVKFKIASWGFFNSPEQGGHAGPPLQKPSTFASVGTGPCACPRLRCKFILKIACLTKYFFVTILS